MTLDLNAVFGGVVTRLSTIPGLRVYATRPFTIDPPAAVLSLEEIKYDTSMGTGDGTDDIIMLAHIFTQMGSDRGETQLYDYMEKTGPESVWAAIDADDSLGGVAHYASVVNVRAPGLAEYGGSMFYAATFEIVVGVGP